MKSYKKFYLKLRSLIAPHALVLDCNSRGLSFGAAKNCIVIYISPAMCWRRMLFMLAHEICHYFNFKVPDLMFKELKNPNDESHASNHAFLLLMSLGCSSVMLTKYGSFDLQEAKHNNECRRVINGLCKN
jgi:hypothetical protein